MENKIKNLIAETIGLSVDKIQNESRIIEDLGADSLDIIEMIMTMEDEFGISISDDDRNSMKTVGEIIKFVESKL